MRAAILLAAGASRRFGRADKLLTMIDGRPLVAFALDRALRCDAGRVILVTARADRRLTALARRSRRVRTIVVPDAGAGLSRSLVAGLAALRPIEREAWIFLGDMPQARAPRGVRLAAGEQAARPWVAGRPGHPMLVRVAAARAALRSGDPGLAAAFGRDVLRRLSGGPGNRLDIDDRDALRRFRRHRR